MRLCLIQGVSDLDRVAREQTRVVLMTLLLYSNLFLDTGFQKHLAYDVSASASFSLSNLFRYTKTRSKPPCTCGASGKSFCLWSCPAWKSKIVACFARMHRCAPVLRALPSWAVARIPRQRVEGASFFSQRNIFPSVQTAVSLPHRTIFSSFLFLFHPQSQRSASDMFKCLPVTASQI